MARCPCDMMLFHAEMNSLKETSSVKLPVFSDTLLWCYYSGDGDDSDKKAAYLVGNLMCCCSVTKSYLTLWPHELWTAAHQAFLSFTISRSLLKLMSIESVMSSNQLILCHSLLLLPSIFPSIRVFSSELALCIRWPRYWSFSFSISPSNESSGLISLGIDWFDLLLSKGLPRVFSSTTIQKRLETFESKEFNMGLFAFLELCCHLLVTN